MQQSSNRQTSWPKDPDCAACSAKLYDGVVSHVLIEVSRQWLEDCSMTWLKIDFHNMGNCVPVRRGGDSRDACWIEVYHSVKSILVAGAQW